MRKIEKEVERETERRERKGQKDRGRENQLKKISGHLLDMVPAHRDKAGAFNTFCSRKFLWPYATDRTICLFDSMSCFIQNILEV